MTRLFWCVYYADPSFKYKTESHSEPSETTKMEVFAKIDNGF